MQNRKRSLQVKACTQECVRWSSYNKWESEETRKGVARACRETLKGDIHSLDTDTVTVSFSGRSQERERSNTVNYEAVGL